MDRKVHVISIIWMLFILILSVWMGAACYDTDGSIVAWIPTITAVIWMICPFILKFCGLDEATNLFFNILFALVQGISAFGEISYIVAFGEAFMNFIMSTGYVNFVYELVDGMHDNKRIRLVATVRKRIIQRMGDYKKIANILPEVDECRKADKLIELLALCSNQSIRELYMEKCNEQNIDLLKKVEEINNQNMLGLNIHDKTISEIRRDVDGKLDALQNREKTLATSSIYELKHYDI